jgi:hypothetical protein
MEIKKTSETQIGVVIRKVMEDIPGGVNLMGSSLQTGTTEIAAGSLVGEDPSNPGKFYLVKTAKLQANATNTATTYRVLKAHQLKVGDFITTKDVVNCKAYAITAIDTTNASYDTLTVGTTLGVAMTAANGVVFIEAAAEDTSGGLSVLKYTPSAITLNAIEISTTVNAWVSAGLRVSVKESILPYYVNDDLKSRLGLNFIFL